jgi:hypothetical protein
MATSGIVDIVQYKLSGLRRNAGRVNQHSNLPINETNPVAPALFRLIHRHIGQFQDVFGTGFIAEEKNHTNARRAVMLYSDLRIVGSLVRQ